MTRDDDFIGQLEGYLEEYQGMTPLPDAVRDAVRAQLPGTGQIGPVTGLMRYLHVNKPLQFAVAAAAVVLVAVLGIAILNRPDTGGPGPTSSATPTASIALLSEQGTIETNANLAPGTYLLADPFPARLAFTVPQGWMVWHVDFLTAGLLVDSGPGDGSGYGLFFLSPGDKLYADPCDKTRGMLDPVPGAAVDDLAAALADLPGMTASTPVDIEIDGHAGKLIELTAPADAAACSAGAATLWDFPGQDDYPMALGERLPVRIIDVDGIRLVIVATDYAGTSAWEVSHGVTFDASDHAEDQVELQAIFDSIRINP